MGQLSDIIDADWARLGVLSDTRPRPRGLRHIFSPRLAPVVLIRVAHCLHVAGFQRLAKLPALLNFVLFGIEVPPRIPIGPGLVLMHTQGTVLGPASIGRNVTIYHQVTLGAVALDFSYTPALRPIVGDGVVIGVGAKVLGSITLGEDSVIGASAVVLKDVPPGRVAYGIPAQIQPLRSQRQKTPSIEPR
jgi:serine O-acetyltransferase